MGELDQLIGDFLELSGQQYVVSTTLTVQDHSVLVEETESLENVTNRTGFDPYFLQKPSPAESNGEGKQFSNLSDLRSPRLTSVHLIYLTFKVHFNYRQKSVVFQGPMLNGINRKCLWTIQQGWLMYLETIVLSQEIVHYMTYSTFMTHNNVAYLSTVLFAGDASCSCSVGLFHSSKNC